MWNDSTKDHRYTPASNLADLLGRAAAPDYFSAKLPLLLPHVSKSHEFCIQNKEICIKNKEFNIENDEFCRTTTTSKRTSSVRFQ